MSEETLRRQLSESFTKRAHIYHLLFSHRGASCRGEHS
jgi:hypothetical protein